MWHLFSKDVDTVYIILRQVAGRLVVSANDKGASQTDRLESEQWLLL